MRNLCFVAAVVILTTTPAFPVFATDDAARQALDAAFARQADLPGYVEHQFGRKAMASSPGSDQTFGQAVGGRAKQRLVDNTRDLMESLPGGTALADATLPTLPPAVDGAPIISTGPEREILTIEHAGKKRRDLLSGAGEIVRANGRIAYRVDLTPQVVQLRAAATVDLGDRGIEQVGRVRDSIRAVAAEIAQGGLAGLLMAAMTAFDQASSTLNAAAGPAQILGVADKLEGLSGKWQCGADNPASFHAGKVIDVQQLADEAIDGVPAHVYSQVRVFESDRSPTANDDDDSPRRDFRLRSRAWVRIADGLPIRSELAMPGGNRQRIEFAYPAKVEFDLPDCVAGS